MRGLHRYLLHLIHHLHTVYQCSVAFYGRSHMYGFHHLAFAPSFFKRIAAVSIDAVRTLYGMGHGKADKGQSRQYEPEWREVAGAKREHRGYHGRARGRQAQVCEAVVASVEGRVVGFQPVPPARVRGGYGRTIPSMVHRYNVRR